MATPYFKFKQFTIWHDKCAMKVGTDGVLLGALAPVDDALRILDVGTGTGLIALMLAQRSDKHDAVITALELDANACIQAQENVEKSPWANRIRVVEADFTTYTSSENYDLIVSNPPYFVDSLKSPLANRSQARHTDTLSFVTLIEKSRGLLSSNGVFAVIIPTDSEEDFCVACNRADLFLMRRVEIQTKPGASAKRVVLMFTRSKGVMRNECLLIELERHLYSQAYISLTKDFYLKM